MRIFYFLILLFMAYAVQAQDKVLPVNASLLPPEKIKFSLNAGTGFFYSPHTYSGSSFFVAPKFSYKVTPKFQINAGVMFVKQSLNLSSSLFSGTENQPRSVVIRNTSTGVQGMMFAEGDYFLTDKLTLSGSVMKTIDMNGKTTDPAWRNSFQMMSMDVNYKISNTITVGAGVRMIQSNGYQNFFPGTFFSPGTASQFSYREF